MSYVSQVSSAFPRFIARRGVPGFDSTMMVETLVAPPLSKDAPLSGQLHLKLRNPLLFLALHDRLALPELEG